MDLEEQESSEPDPEAMDMDAATQNALLDQARWRSAVLSLPTEMRSLLTRELMSSLPRTDLHELPLDLRTVLAKELMDTLPTSQIAALIEEARKRLYFDPMSKLPPEVSFQLLEYLSPKEVCKAALVSQNWKTSAYQSAIWKRLFILEGWPWKPESIAQFQANISGQLALYLSRDRSQDPLPNNLTNRSSIPRLWIRACSIATIMLDSDGRRNVHQNEIPRNRALTFDAALLHTLASGFQCPLMYPPNSQEWDNGAVQFNWRHLYTQRQRLERNWQAKRFTNFRIPREDHDWQKHGECVYTLQFTNKHVVSGSRDKTVRVWDMDKRILKMPPLAKHQGSVLCLQFDESPERDVIISGGSDAAVVVWRFSTGAIIKHIKKAHEQAVLNLIFDHRYLITCSKDSSIKIWNMDRLSVIDDAYPATNNSRNATYPDYIIDKRQLEYDLRLELTPPLEPYTHIMTLTGHEAAVNAISVHDDEIISVSGDRTAMRWKLSTGTRIKTYGGHNKGIACVHYDGTRIVSGSSDETIRIFDPETGAEVDLLKGHRDLVRTIQADFCDVAGAKIEYEAKAKAHTAKVLLSKRTRLAAANNIDSDRLFGEVQNRLRGSHPPPHPSNNSSKDEPYLVNARLPPGGGGNRYAKIVSGSYDETIHVWKQNPDGRWVQRYVLGHEDAMNATSHRPRSNGPQQGSAISAEQFAGMVPEMQAHYQRLQRQRNLHTAQGWMNTGANARGQPMAPGNMPQQPWPQLGQIAPVTLPGLPQGPPQGPPRLPRNAANLPAQTHAVPVQMQPQPHPQHPQAGAPPAVAQQPAQQEEEEGTSRLFKLQFDARRIVCCSQQPIIIGWDFANGDREIIEASQFFAETK